MVSSYFAVCATFPKCHPPYSCQAPTDALTYISLVIGFKSGLKLPSSTKWDVPRLPEVVQESATSEYYLVGEDKIKTAWLSAGF